MKRGEKCCQAGVNKTPQDRQWPKDRSQSHSRPPPTFSRAQRRSPIKAQPMTPATRDLVSLGSVEQRGMKGLEEPLTRFAESGQSGLQTREVCKAAAPPIG